jgi:hypothetical protein
LTSQVAILDKQTTIIKKIKVDRIVKFSALTSAPNGAQNRGICPQNHIIATIVGLLIALYFFEIEVIENHAIQVLQLRKR